MSPTLTLAESWQGQVCRGAGWGGVKGSLLQGMAQIPTKTGTFPVSKGAAWWIFLLVFSWLYLVFPLEPPGAMLTWLPGEDQSTRMAGWEPAQRCALTLGGTGEEGTSPTSPPVSQSEEEEPEKLRGKGDHRHWPILVTGRHHYRHRCHYSRPPVPLAGPPANVPSSLLTISDAEIRGAHARLLKRWAASWTPPFFSPSSLFSLWFPRSVWT
jgi:hypothetical protein